MRATHALVASVLTAAAALVSAQSPQIAEPPELASLYALTTSTSIPFPSATLSPSDAQKHVVDAWSLHRGRIQQGADRIAFVADPFPDKPVSTSTKTQSGPVLSVEYPQGKFGSKDSGLQLYSLWNASTPFQSMLVSYEVAFDADFDFVKGGKLPGLRGGPDSDNGCAGQHVADGANCFSTRLMWRKGAAGEVYSYIPLPDSFCSSKGVMCNSDSFGTSIDRKSFSFVAGQWNRVTILVRLNDPLDVANGEVEVYYNNARALDEQTLQYRNSTDVDIGGLWLSTFFGGNDDSWAPPSTVKAYFRDFELWGSSAPSNLTGASVNVAKPLSGSFSLWSFLALAVALFRGAIL